MNINGRDIVFSSFVYKDFDKLLEDIRQEYNRVKANNADVHRQLDEWNKDEEILKAQEWAEYYRGHSLCQLTDKELASIKTFRAKHYASCKNGNKYQFELTGTGVGEAIDIRCPICGESENITDYDAW